MNRKKYLKWLSSIGAGFLMIGCATQDVRQPSSIAGVNYNRGTYVCINKEKGLTARFTFSSESATLETPSGESQLRCTPAREASEDDKKLFLNAQSRPVDICVGQGAKGSFVIGSSNSMGIVQVRAFLLKSGGKTTSALLNCEAAAKEEESW